MGIRSTIKNFRNVFAMAERAVTQDPFQSSISMGSILPQQRSRYRSYNDKTIVTAIYNRLAVDVADIDIRHIKLDEDERYDGDQDSDLTWCLKYEPNIDQGPRQFRQDICMTMLDEGVACIVPVDTTRTSDTGAIVDIQTIRVGWVTQWYPKHVKVSLYNVEKGIREEVVLEKRHVAIIENPLYSVMNEQNSTLQRLVRKLSLLDAVDEQSASGKLDLIIQLPYVIKSDARRAQAEQRRQDIEFQLKGSQYGIAYTDGTEKVTQLNRPAENNLLKQVEYLTAMLYGQLGLTEDIMNGTADDKAMINYFNRTVKPIIESIAQGMNRSWIGRNRIKSGELIKYFQDPFRLVPIGDLAELADKFTRNEILTANEFRQILGFRPSKDPKADQLINSNMPQPDPAGEGEKAQQTAEQSGNE